MVDKDSSSVIVEPQGEATSAIIWLHGLGADGHDFEDIVPALEVGGVVRFIFPHAPFRPVTINLGATMRAWYDITSIDLESNQDNEGIREAEKIVQSLIAGQIDQGITASRILLAGFSQGGAVVLHTALRYPRRLAGVIAMSTYVPLAADLPDQAHPANLDVPIWMAHGTDDTVVPLKYGQISRNLLQSLGYHVDWHEYPMDHAVCAEEIQHIAVFIRSILQ